MQTARTSTCDARQAGISVFADGTRRACAFPTCSVLTHPNHELRSFALVTRGIVCSCSPRIKRKRQFVGEQEIQPHQLHHFWVIWPSDTTAPTCTHPRHTQHSPLPRYRRLEHWTRACCSAFWSTMWPVTVCADHIDHAPLHSDHEAVHTRGRELCQHVDLDEVPTMWHTGEGYAFAICVVSAQQVIYCLFTRVSLRTGPRGSTTAT